MPSFPPIQNAEEFVRLRSSEIEEEYNRAAHAEASIAVWLDVIARFPDMKSWIAHNKTVPLEILEILSTDEDVDVRFTVAQKRKLTPELFEKLSEDIDETVRMRVACNAQTPKTILEKLASDQCARVAKWAKKRLS